MSTREVAELASRILALTLLCFSIFEVVAVVGMCLLSLERSIHADSLGELSNLGVGLVVIGIPVALKLVVIWFLWTRADWVADKLVPQSGTYSRWPRVRAADMQVAAFSCVGLVFFCWGVRSLCGYVTVFLEMSRYSNLTLGEFFRSDVFVAAIANVVIGIWLLLGSRGVVRFVRRLRQEDRNDELPTPDTDMEQTEH